MDKPFVLPIETALGKYIYEVNRNEIIKVNKQLYDLIQYVLDGGSLDHAPYPADIKQQYMELIDCGYLSSHHVTEILHPLTDQTKYLLDRAVSKIALQVTQDCNLRCKYCIYSETGNNNQRHHTSKMMSRDIAFEAINFYYKHSVDSDEAIVGFYGGEPLLAFDLIVEVVEYVKKLFFGKEIVFFITTNATLLSDNIIDFLVKNNFRIAFSLDGPKETQNRNRVFKDGYGSYEIVMNNIRKLYLKDPAKLKNASISMVVDTIQDYVSLVDWMKKPELANVDIALSMVEKDGITLPPSDKFIEQMNYDWFVELARILRGANLNEENKILKQSNRAFISGRTKVKSNVLRMVAAPNGPCVPGKIRLLVSSEGNFYPCEKVNENEVMRIGSLADGFDFAKIKQLLNIGKIGSEKCKNCWAFQLCGICAKRADNGKCLDPLTKSEACEVIKNDALTLLHEKIVLFENGVHLSEMKKGK